jgi:hypothetical protein
LTFEKVYYSDRRVAEPGAELREAAERHIEFLHTERVHTLSTSNGRSFLRAPLNAAQGWYVTYTPTCAECDAEIVASQVFQSQRAYGQALCNNCCVDKDRERAADDCAADPHCTCNDCIADHICCIEQEQS